MACGRFPLLLCSLSSPAVTQIDHVSQVLGHFVTHKGLSQTHSDLEHGSGGGGGCGGRGTQGVPASSRPVIEMTAHRPFASGSMTANYVLLSGRRGRGFCVTLVHYCRIIMLGGELLILLVTVRQCSPLPVPWRWDTGWNVLAHADSLPPSRLQTPPAVWWPNQPPTALEVLGLN